MLEIKKRTLEVFTDSQGDDHETVELALRASYRKHIAELIRTQDMIAIDRLLEQAADIVPLIQNYLDAMDVAGVKQPAVKQLADKAA